MTTEPGSSPGGRTVERLDRAYREANRLVVAAGLVLAGAGVDRSSPAIQALSSALRAVNGGRDLLRRKPPCIAPKEAPHAHPRAFGRRYRRAAP